MVRGFRPTDDVCADSITTAFSLLARDRSHRLDQLGGGIRQLPRGFRRSRRDLLCQLNYRGSLHPRMLADVQRVQLETKSPKGEDKRIKNDSRESCPAIV